MSRRPAILRQRRWIGLLILVALAFGQAVTIIVTAFATRDVFMVLREGGSTVPVTALVAIALAGSALFALRALEGSVAERTGQSYAADIREALFKHITRMPASAIARRRSGALALRYVGDLTAFKGWVSRGLARLISASITIPSAFVVLYLLQPWLFAVYSGWADLSAWPILTCERGARGWPPRWPSVCRRGSPCAGPAGSGPNSNCCAAIRTES